MEETGVFVENPPRRVQERNLCGKKTLRPESANPWQDVTLASERQPQLRYSSSQTSNHTPVDVFFFLFVFFYYTHHEGVEKTGVFVENPPRQAQERNLCGKTLRPESANPWQDVTLTSECQPQLRYSSSQTSNRTPVEVFFCWFFFLTHHELMKETGVFVENPPRRAEERNLCEKPL